MKRTGGRRAKGSTLAFGDPGFGGDSIIKDDVSYESFSSPAGRNKSSGGEINEITDIVVNTENNYRFPTESVRDFEVTRGGDILKRGGSTGRGNNLVESVNTAKSDSYNIY